MTAVSGVNDDIKARLLLVDLPKISPSRTRWLLDAAEPGVVIRHLRRGQLPPDIGPAPTGLSSEVIRRWQKHLAVADVEELLQRHREHGVELMGPDDVRWPFGDDPDPPVLLFYSGDTDLLAVATSVGVVGTRRCTTVGRTVAYGFGHDLASAGVAVVSGLALGIDGAAHRGALDAGGAAIGVVGSGLDVVYPGGNRDLWQSVATEGLLLSEAPVGTKPQRWRFPARNRLIAGLSDGIVIVESHHRGGALHTVDEMADRGGSVYAVPGSVLSPASDGTNHLLVEGAIPVRTAEDALLHLGVPSGTVADGDANPTGGPTDSAEPAAVDEADAVEVVIDVAAGDPAGDVVAGAEPADAVASVAGEEPIDDQIMAEVATGPCHMDVLVQATGQDVLQVTIAVQRLVANGRVVLDGSTVSLRL